MNTKKVVAAAALLCLTVSGSYQAIAAENGITVVLNGEKMTFDAEPRIINDRTMVPMRAIFEELGCSVNWFGEDQLIIALKEPLIISMMIGKTVMPVQNIETQEQEIIKLDSPPVIEEDYTFVPVRAISEALGAEVGWDAQTMTVTIDMPDVQ